MKAGWLLAGSLAVFAGAAISTARPADSPVIVPRYTDDGRLVLPADYREWIFLSSGLGMSYRDASGDQFTNVFVTPAAYREFLASGKWPEKTMFVVEEREAASKGSINKGGHYQSELAGIGVEVKDAARFPEVWAYFTFGPHSQTARANPKSVCWQCHEEHAAVEHSFVQFYPTLEPIARKFLTYRESAR